MTAGTMEPVADVDGYLLDNQWPGTGGRLALLATLFDPTTFRRMEALGIAPGWHCWEVGAGGPSVATWMSGRVGAEGTVLATDVDPSWLSAPEDHPFEVRRHDIGAEPAPAGPFDLIHARLVLMHVPNRSEALTRMAAALRPGGWLLVEDADSALQPLTCIDEYGPEQRLANRLRRGFRTLLAERGADLEFGRTLPRYLRHNGLVDVGADAHFHVAGPECTQLERATVEQIREQLVAAGLATDTEIDQHLQSVDSGTMDFATSLVISAWGRKPPAH